jgi:hypothetical protein
MIVRENIEQFKRGQGSKRGLDVGIKRKDNMQDFIERGLESELSQFTPKFAVVRNDDRTKHWVRFESKPWMGENEIKIWAEMHDFRNNRPWQNLFKRKTKEWIEKNTDFKIENFLKNRKFNYFWILLK